VVVTVKVTPRARHETIEGVGPDGALRVKVTAPADDGKANAAVIALLARCWNVPKSALSITSGHTSRRKRIHLRGDPAMLAGQIAALIGAA
jgi:uncharacterized protein